MVELALMASVAIAVILVILLVAFVLWRRKHKASKGANYKALLTMGIVWLAVGLIYMFYRPGPDGTNTLLPLGLVFCTVGLFGMLMARKEKQVVANTVS